MLALLLLATTAPSQQRAFSTHDWSNGGGIGRPEAWADVKSPGDGRNYAVGTCEVREVATQAPYSQFSDSEVRPVLGLPPIGVPPASPNNVQIVILQASNEVGGIQWQRYFYGTSPTATLSHLATNARGISVWPVADANGQPDRAATRIAICGETYEETIPGSQASRGPGFFSNNASPGGFVAVFDGDGNHLWSHHFFGPRSDDDSAITDISIHVEATTAGLQDVVTYCGISSIGTSDPAPATTHPPFRPFNAPTSPCPSAAGGATDNGRGQWDGIVGRLSRLQTGSMTTTEFHSVVGGRWQDGLFGIAEIDFDRFCVVGSTAIVQTPGTGTRDFPFTTGACISPLQAYCVGVAMVFRSP